MNKVILRKLIIPAALAIIPASISAHIPFVGWEAFQRPWPGWPGAGIVFFFVVLVIAIGLLPFQSFCQSLGVRKSYTTILLLFSGSISGYLAATIMVGGHFRYGIAGIPPAIAVTVVWLLINFYFEKEKHV